MRVCKLKRPALRVAAVQTPAWRRDRVVPGLSYTRPAGGLPVYCRCIAEGDAMLSMDIGKGVA